MGSANSANFSRELKTQALILGSFVGIFWLLEILDVFVFHHSLDRFGIQPHSLVGLRGILFAPFLHGGFLHLMANTVPFLVLGWFVMLQETSDFWIVTALTMLVGGLGTWIFGGAGSVHVGASILIFGYLGFLLFRGFFQRNLPSIALSMAALFLYGGALWGVLPLQAGVSWQGHLFGFLGGFWAAQLIAKEKRFYADSSKRR
ncbi:MAG: rhomboid family intramembrane serine protease [Cyanobacteriota bacterium]|jgi:membrane associated rhomboid family serine protease